MKNKFALLAALSALFVLIFASDEVISSSRYALGLCAELIFPSLFPFFVISSLLAKLGLPALLEKVFGKAASKMFKVSGRGASALFIGLCSGYPMGAAYIVELYEDRQIGKNEAEKLLSFCNNSGPAFIIGVVGAGVFHSAKIGLLLYFVHALSAVICGVIFRGKGTLQNGTSAEYHQISFSKAFPEAVKQSVISALNVCGFVVCFTVFTALLDANGFLSLFSAWLSSIFHLSLSQCKALISGIFELGSAAGLMRGLSPTADNIALAAGILGWGGISVHFQTMAFISDTEIKGTLHFAGRLLSAVLSFILCYYSLRLFA